MHTCNYDAGPVPFLGALVNNISKVTVGKRLHYNFASEYLKDTPIASKQYFLSRKSTILTFFKLKTPYWLCEYTTLPGPFERYETRY
jgi:hypothetical protein